MATKTEMPDQALDAQRNTLAGDLRDHLVGFIRFNGALTPWDKRTEEDQRDIVEQCSRLSDFIVDQVVDIVASAGEKAVTCTIKKVGGDDKGIHITLDTPFSHETWSNLGDARAVKLVVADSKEFSGERQPGHANVQPDQGDLVTEAEQAPVMDQTAVGKKTGGKKRKPKDADPEPAAPASPPGPRSATQDDLNPIAAAAKRKMDEGAGFDAAVTVAAQEMDIDLQSLTGEMMDKIQDIVGFEDPPPAEPEEAEAQGEEEPSAI